MYDNNITFRRCCQSSPHVRLTRILVFVCLCVWTRHVHNMVERSSGATNARRFHRAKRTKVRRTCVDGNPTVFLDLFNSERYYCVGASCTKTPDLHRRYYRYDCRQQRLIDRWHLASPGGRLSSSHLSIEDGRRELTVWARVRKIEPLPRYRADDENRRGRAGWGSPRRSTRDGRDGGSFFSRGVGRTYAATKIVPVEIPGDDTTGWFVGRQDPRGEASWIRVKPRNAR